MEKTGDILRETAVVILCAGQGSRMKSSDRHKVCFPIRGVPAIVRGVGMFRRLGARKIVLVVGALAEHVLATVGEKYPDVVYVYQHSQMGTGHAAQVAAAALRSSGHTGPILVTMGDKVIEPRVIRDLAERFLESSADLVFVTGPKIREGVVSGSGRIVTDRAGRILGNVEVRDIQRAKILESLAGMAARQPRKNISYDQIIRTGLRDIPDEKKLRVSLWPLEEKIREAGRVTGRRLLDLLGAEPGRLVLAGTSRSAGAIERGAKTVNLSVYLGSAEFWNRFLPRLQNNNAQREFYLTDAINLAVEDKRDWKIAQLVVADPTEVMAFNSPDELLRIEDVFRRKTQTKMEEIPLPGGMARPAGQWLEIFERRPAGLRNRFKRLYGYEEAADRRGPLFAEALRTFIEHFGADREAIVIRAPGRINLLGRHVDHRGGAVNVMAIDRDVVFVAAARDDDVVRLRSATPKRFPSREFSVRELLGDMPWDNWINFVNSDYVKGILAQAPGDWSNYVKASMLRLQQGFQDKAIRGFDAAVAGDIPVAAGLSSSSALVVAAMETAVVFNGLEATPAEIVDFCGTGEWFVGSRGGASDHSAIRLGQRGRLLPMQFLPFRVGKAYAFPRQCALTIAHSGLDAPKSAGAKNMFNQKVASYELGFLLLKERTPQYAHLLEHVRDINPTRLGCPIAEIYRMLLRVPEHMPLVEIRRALSKKHGERIETVLSSHEPPEKYDLRGVLLYGIAECARSAMAPGLLISEEVEEFAHLMNVSHDGDRLMRFWRSGRGAWRSRPYQCDCSDAALLRLCEDLEIGDLRRVLRAQLHAQPGAYGCSVPGIDKMVDAVRTLPGVYGAQLGGAGLGGCIMILSRPEAVEGIRETLTREYYEKAGKEPLVHLCHPVSGSGALVV